MKIPGAGARTASLGFDAIEQRDPRLALTFALDGAITISPRREPWEREQKLFPSPDWGLRFRKH